MRYANDRGRAESHLVRSHILTAVTIDGQDPEEQGNVLPSGSAQGQAGQTEEGAANSVKRRRRRRLRLRRGEDRRGQYRLHRLSVGGQEHAHEQTDGPTLRGCGLRVYYPDLSARSGYLQRLVARTHILCRSLKAAAERNADAPSHISQAPLFKSSTFPESSRVPRTDEVEVDRSLPWPKLAISSSSCWT